MSTKQKTKSSTDTVRSSRLPVNDIVPDPNQPRKTLSREGLNELTQSLLGSGQISPVVVRSTSGGKYVIVVGERRWRAAKEAGLSHVDCIIRHDVDDQKARELQLAENYQREDVPPLEQARALKGYLDKYGVSQSESARRTGIPQRTISARLALLSLPPSMHARIGAGEIGPYEALRIAELPAHQQEAMASLVSAGKIGGRMLEKLLLRIRSDPRSDIGEIMQELTSASTILPSATSANASGDTPRVPSNKHGDSTSEIVQSDEEKGEIETQGERREVNRPSDADILVAAARDLGSYYQDFCHHLNDQKVCEYWHWDTKEDIPEGFGEPVNLRDSWHIRPSALYCAFCINAVWDRIGDVEDALEGNPISGLRWRFKCECGTPGKVAVYVKCTKCGRRSWWGWEPE